MLKYKGRIRISLKILRRIRNKSFRINNTGKKTLFFQHFPAEPHGGTGTSLRQGPLAVRYGYLAAVEPSGGTVPGCGWWPVPADGPR